MPYSTSPWLAWSGWRLRVPGGPAGGQYHGFIAPDDVVNRMGWPSNPQEIFRPMDNPQNLGVYPWNPWDTSMIGIPLREGETVSDFVYRGPAELRPRANASGGLNTVDAVQLQRTPGFAIAPGNYRTLGATAAPVMAVPTSRFGIQRIIPMPTQQGEAPDQSIAFLGPPVPASHPVCPAWGCGPPPGWHDPAQYYDGTLPPAFLGPPVSPAPSPVVSQPPPPTSPQPGPTVPIGPGGSSGCAAGMYRDAAGNCTADWSHPYPLYLPLDTSISPAPTVPANTCPTGYSQDASGNCLAPGLCPTGYVIDAQGNCVLQGAPTSGITAWLSASTPLLGLNVPNYLLAGAGALVAFRLMRGGRR